MSDVVCGSDVIVGRKYRRRATPRAACSWRTRTKEVWAGPALLPAYVVSGRLRTMLRISGAVLMAGDVICLFLSTHQLLELQFEVNEHLSQDQKIRTTILHFQDSSTASRTSETDSSEELQNKAFSAVWNRGLLPFLSWGCPSSREAAVVSRKRHAVTPAARIDGLPLGQRPWGVLSWRTGGSVGRRDGLRARRRPCTARR